MTLITSGTLILSLTFIDKVVKLQNSIALWCLVTSWCLLALTLLVNLISHQVSSHLHEATVNDFRTKNPSTLDNVSKRNSIINSINWVTTGTLISAIIFIIIFCSLNAYNMNRDTEHTKPQIIDPDQQRGMPINVPRGPNIPSQPLNPQPQPAQPQQPTTNPGK